MSRDILVYGNDDSESPVLDFLDRLSYKELAKCFAYIALLQEHGNRLTSQFIKHVEGDLWELRPEFGGVEIRLFYFAWVADSIVIVHALKKKSGRVRRREIDLALKRIGEIRNAEANILQILPE